MVIGSIGMSQSVEQHLLVKYHQIVALSLLLQRPGDYNGPTIKFTQSLNSFSSLPNTQITTLQ